MGRRLLPAITLLAGLAIGAGGALWWMGRSEPTRSPDAGLAAGPAGDVAIALEAPEPNPEGLPRIPPEGLLPPEAKTHPQYFEDLEEEAPEGGVPEALPAEVDYPRLEKLAVASEVPHRTVGAWDESPESDTPGRRRAFVMVVEPDVPDAELEALARDLRAQHGDARILSVRIYDSEEGARRASWVDGGELAHQHLVAEVNVNEALGLDAIRIRGRRIDP